MTMLGSALRRRRGIQLFQRACLSTPAYYEKEDTPPLVELEAAKLGFPSTSHILTEPIDLTVQHPSMGGHVLLGRNGTGKSLLSNTLASRGHKEYLKGGSFFADRTTMISHVSFESHEDLLAEGGTAYKAIADGNLSKAAQFLVVRFGLFPLLYRDVNTLSTGEIRKVMLIRALASCPRLLVLDNSFDGLDVPSREILKDLVSRTLRGFRPDILVQGISANNTAHTQVLMMTHRAEEIVPEIGTVNFFQERILQTESRDERSGHELLSSALNITDEYDAEPWKDSSLPSVDSIASWWKSHRTKSEQRREGVLVQTENLCIRRGDATLIDNVNWTVEKGQHWLVAGKNGSGKSTLSRLLACNESGIQDGNLRVLDDSHAGEPGVRRERVGWVATESHMAAAKSDQATYDILCSNAPPEVAHVVAEWLGMDEQAKLSRPFSQLSQGEQKLILIASAIASRPELLVLDEPCQGLDLLNRHRVLGLVERLCKATDMSLIYITHHLEELVPSITHVLHLQDGTSVYNGTREAYDPEAISTNEEDR